MPYTYIQSAGVNVISQTQFREAAAQLRNTAKPQPQTCTTEFVCTQNTKPSAPANAIKAAANANVCVIFGRYASQSTKSHKPTAVPAGRNAISANGWRQCNGADFGCTVRHLHFIHTVNRDIPICWGPIAYIRVRGKFAFGQQAGTCEPKTGSTACSMPYVCVCAC